MYEWVWPRINRLRPPRHLYQNIEKELKSKPDWPKLSGNSNFSAGKANRSIEARKFEWKRCTLRITYSVSSPFVSQERHWHIPNRRRETGGVRRRCPAHRLSDLLTAFRLVSVATETPFKRTRTQPHRLTKHWLPFWTKRMTFFWSFVFPFSRIFSLPSPVNILKRKWWPCFIRNHIINVQKLVQIE